MHINKNYRETVVKNSADYQSRLRDERIYNIGMKVMIRVPMSENEVNEYNDFEYTNDGYATKVTYIEPRFSNYYEVLNILGQNAEKTLPLEISILTNEHLPKDSIIQIREKNTNGDLVLKEWRVLSTETKQIGNFYSRLAFAVPARREESIVLPPDYKPEKYNFNIVIGAISSTEKFSYLTRSPSVLY